MSRHVSLRGGFCFTPNAARASNARIFLFKAVAPKSQLPEVFVSSVVSGGGFVFQRVIGNQSQSVQESSVVPGGILKAHTREPERFRRVWLCHLLNWQERPRRAKKSNRELELDYLLWSLSSAILLHCG